MKTAIRVEFTIDADHLGRVVLMVEEAGAADFSFTAIKKPEPPQRRKKPEKPPLAKKRRKRRSSPITDAAIGLLHKGPASRADISKVTIAAGGSPTSVPGLIFRLQQQGILSTPNGDGMYRLSKAASNSAAEVT